MRAVVFLLMLGGFLIGCSSSKKTVESTAQSKVLEALIAKKSFNIQSDWMYPLATSSMNVIANSGLLPPGSTVNGISLIGNPNHIKFHGDSISMDLPFYGERQLPGQYTRNEGGIVFNGVPDRYEVTKDEKRQRHIIKFTVKNNRESYRVMVTLYPNWTSNININSSHRTSIRYRGDVSTLEKDNGLVTN
ncbi:DUF4251 domain-containing protein [Aquimarina sp. MMG015]|uniref:DUF4251 domain-containing protein n=1 Tax=Aquimarina sp. MMG015 TaxID=2822689 RepID=UPI001B3A3133|nr:DUF4251 domain-containing protein [Aquimarina sp. MMG015]MBQ4802204.1 DUF4251 domain-containing protein [Aquimarina sp. MMG015]